MLKKETHNQIKISSITHSSYKVFSIRISTEKASFSLAKKAENPMRHELCLISLWALNPRMLNQIGRFEKYFRIFQFYGIHSAAIDWVSQQHYDSWNRVLLIEPVLTRLIEKHMDIFIYFLRAYFIFLCHIYFLNKDKSQVFKFVFLFLYYLNLERIEHSKIKTIGCYNKKRRGYTNI